MISSYDRFINSFFYLLRSGLIFVINLVLVFYINSTNRVLYFSVVSLFCKMY